MIMRCNTSGSWKLRVKITKDGYKSIKREFGLETRNYFEAASRALLLLKYVIATADYNGERVKVTSAETQSYLTLHDVKKLSRILIQQRKKHIEKLKRDAYNAGRAAQRRSRKKHKQAHEKQVDNQLLLDI